MTPPFKLRQLLSQRAITQWLEQFTRLGDNLSIAVFETDGKQFAVAGNWADKMLDVLSDKLSGGKSQPEEKSCRFYPLHADTIFAGTLVINKTEYATQDLLEKTVQQGLELILNEAAEKLSLADETLDGYREINLLYRVGETIGATLDPDKIRAMVLEESRKIIDIDAGAVITILDDVWQTVATIGKHEMLGLIDIVARFHDLSPRYTRPAIITDFTVDNLTCSSLLWAPMTASAGTLGGVILARGQGKDVFIASDEKLLATLARQAAVALDNASLFEDTKTYAQHLQKLNQISREISSSLDVAVVIDRILESALDLLHAEAGTLFLVEGPSHDLVFRVVRGGTEDLVGQHLPAGTGIVGQVADSGQAQIVHRVEENQKWFEGVDESTGFVTQSIIAVPMLKQDESIGVLELLNKQDGSNFEERDIVLLETLAAQATVALENAHLHQAELIKQRMQRELQLGFEMQSGLIPANVPELEGWDFAAWWQPAREVSGDFYDFILLPDQLGVVIADVADKGVQAALFMALTRSLVRASIRAHHEPADDLNRANSLIAADASKGMFVTLCYVRFERDGRATYVNAGHNPPLYYQAAAESLVEFEPTGILMGLEEDIPLGQKTVSFKLGDFVVLFTDGITEAMNSAREEFGETRLQNVIMTHRDDTSEDIRDAILAAIRNFVGETPASDDITLVIAKRI